MCGSFGQAVCGVSGKKYMAAAVNSAALSRKVEVNF
jgi:hypothetical protein